LRRPARTLAEPAHGPARELPRPPVDTDPGGKHVANSDSMSAARLGLNGFPRVPRVIVSFNLGGARIALGPESSTECARSGRDKPHLSTRRPKAADSSVILPDSIFARSRMSLSSVSGAREREPPPTPRF